ncbi:MAG TPA: peptidyl-prolyl cis-trans isomerase [Verrucomicrobiae bacterium]|nr:peptidyl-prolyl cis-trans isomerase [Verrucomicrobiae bacterium]
MKRHVVMMIAAAVLVPGLMSMAADVIDGVMAIVNDKVITFSQVLELVQPVDRELRRNFSGAELEEQRRKAQTDALNTLIEHALIVQEFNTKGYKIPDTVVDQQINDIISKEYGGNRAAFVKTLEAENLTLSQFREQELERIILQVMRNHKAQQTIIVSPYKIQKYYQENIDQFKVGDQIKLRMIFVKRGEPVATGTMAAEQPSSTSTNQSALTNAEAIAVATNSGPSASTTNMAASATTTNSEVSTATTNSETSGTAPPPAVDLQRRLAEEILAKLDAGDSFESLARVYSEGKEAKEGGDWGWIGHDVLRKELNEIAFTLKAGQHSRIIETAEGYYILEVDDVKPAHTTPLAEVRDDIEKTLLQEQRAKMQEDWVKDLRAKAYIRIF